MQRSVILIIWLAISISLAALEHASGQSAPVPPSSRDDPASAPNTPCDPPPALDAETNRLHVRRRPDPNAALRFYPERAYRLGISGHVQLRCLVTSIGELVTCQVLDETPGGQGFGEASQRLAKTFSFAPVVKDGAPVKCGVYSFRLNWGPQK